MRINLGLDRKSLSFALVISIIFALAMPSVFPHWRIMFFAPYLIIYYYQKSYLSSLWASFACGLFIDIFSADARMGLHGLGYCLTTCLLYRLRVYFFADSWSTLALMTFFFSMIAAGFELALMNIIEHAVGTSWQWVLTDLVYMPAVDALYAFFFFIFPAFFFSRQSKRGRQRFAR